MATSTSAPALSFQNDLPYDIAVYDSFKTDPELPAEDNYFAHLTLLGNIAANSTASIQPIRNSYALIVENVTDKKPLKRCLKLAAQNITSFTSSKADEDAMKATFTFVDLFLDHPSDAPCPAFQAVLLGGPDGLAGRIKNFFAGQPAYAACTFETYSMAMAYTALHPEDRGKPPAEARYSLTKLVKMMGGGWPPAMPDVDVTNFTCSTNNNVLDISVEIDINAFPYETPDITNNVQSMGFSERVTAQVQFNYGISLGVLGTRLGIVLDTINIPVGSSGTCSISKPSITIDINPLFKFVVFTLRGIIPFSLFNKPFDANISMVIDNVEAEIGVVIEGDNSSLPAPPVMKGVHFDQFGIGIGMGIFFKPAGFSLGLQGKFHIGEPAGTNVVDLNDDTFAVVCKMNGDVPEPVYASFYVPAMDVNKVVEIFTDSSANIDVPITFTDLSFRWAENPMEPYTLPDGTLSEMGYGFSAAVSIFWLNFYGEVAIDATNGLSAHIEMSPLKIGKVLTLSGDGKGVTIKVDANGNPVRNNQIRDTKVLQDALATATDKQLVSPGGPVLEINTFKQPFLHLNGKISLFELVDYEIGADISLNLISFYLDFGSILSAKMYCSLHEGHNFYATFNFGIDRTVTFPPVGSFGLGSFRLQTMAGADLWITTSASDVIISVEGGFDFMGSHYNTGKFTVDIPIQQITNLLDAIFSTIEQEAKQIFGDLVGDASSWASHVKSGLITTCDTVSSTLINLYDKSLTEVTLIMKGAGYDAGEIASDMKRASYDAQLVVSELKNTAGLGVDGVESAMKWAGYEVPEVIGALQRAFSINDIASALKTVYGLDVNKVNSFLQSAGYTADQVGSAFTSLGGEFASFAQTTYAKIKNPDTWNPSNW